jgi:hypothetical protein
MRIALASCKRLPEPDPDQPVLTEALGRAGHEVRVLAWDDDASPFCDHDLTILRSTWNYYERVDDFIGWATRTAKTTRMLNPPSIVATNATKTYLRDLSARGVDVVPTEFVDRGARIELLPLLESRGWDAIVIKPVVSAASYRTKRFDRTTAATSGQSFLDDLLRERGAMVQAWMPSVDTYGERSLVFIDGEVTHAIRKTPRFAGGVEQVSAEVPIADDERAFAMRALAPFMKDILYARVDMVRDEAPTGPGVLRVMELEMIEPSLFFTQSSRALDRFVAALAARAK